MSSTNTVLLLGGTGKVGSRIAPLLQAAGVPTLIASRSPKAPTGVKFDWDDEATWTSALTHSPAIQTVYLVVSTSPNAIEVAHKFIDLAREKGVKRFVLLSASCFEEGGPFLGQTHKYLHQLGDEGKIEWAVLRPTWFQENFLHDPRVNVLKKESKMYSATGAGRIPWVSTRDIAAVAFHALTTPKAPNTDLLILGPELLTYDDLAKIFTSVLSRPIIYKELSEADLSAHWVEIGIPPTYAQMLSALETEIKGGSEDRTSDVVRTLTGNEPRPFKEFLEENKTAWD
ncbi:putative ergot alkaloid A [Hypoxylon trugodes]|uniref:putative ergot alkaloid A n=1 Tax=Hypoxylon trugodes TaxID=326681 RepID=UPI00218EAC91|nr:putative ergot alkaloid A [Hypoxylon trugodes]KAI1384150.1 putative ergot alkaloid A [Hypoxylon trugodes]